MQLFSHLSDQSNVVAQRLNRRAFLGRTSLGIGSVALASLLNRDGIAAVNEAEINDLPELLHFAAKVKRVIFVYGWWTVPSENVRF